VAAGEEVPDPAWPGAGAEAEAEAAHPEAAAETVAPASGAEDPPRAPAGPRKAGP